MRIIRARDLESPRTRTTINCCRTERSYPERLPVCSAGTRSWLVTCIIRALQGNVIIVVTRILNNVIDIVVVCAAPSASGWQADRI